MLPEQAADPLERFPVFRTSNSEEFRDAVLTRFGATGVELKSVKGLVARGSLIQLQDIGLVHGASNTGATIRYPELDRFRLMTALTGRGEATVGGVTTELTANQSCIVSPGRAARVAGEGSHGWLTLRVGAGATEQKLISLLGAKPNGRLEFAPAVDRNHPRALGLWQLISFFATQLSSTSAGLPPMVLRELEQAIIVGFLCAHRHSFSHLLERDDNDLAPANVRRVEEYIEAHWHEAITIESLTQEIGVSARAIFRAFARSRGYSPMAFAKMVRLRRAREMLAAPGSATSVTRVASACGFANMGHFAKDYRDAFGERPSATLARAARGF
jgi:AraC-like DNA-binding protein